MRTLYQACLMITAVVFVAACSPDPTVETVDTPSHGTNVSWFQGDLDSAFAAAVEQDKPVFFYWGADWCPPCQEIRNTVFKSSRFLELSKEFVAVYMDGDTERAQQAGEQFGVKGYPTMIVFDKTGVELTRIPGGIDIAKYNDVLGLALDSITPTKELVRQLIAGETLTEKDLKQLAFYSWGQDFTALPEEYDVEIFAKAAEQSNNPITASRLYMQYLSEQMSDEATVVPGALEKVSGFLNDDSLVLANWGAFAYYTEELLPLLAEAPNREALKTNWLGKVRALRKHQSLSTADQLGGFLPDIVFHFAEYPDSELPVDVATDLRAAVARADNITTNASARQSVVSNISYILQQAKLYDDARAILTAELEKSEAPYYFMSSLSALAEKEEDIEAAVAWRKQAYETSVGNATRLQWGGAYVRALIRMTPEANEEILRVTEELVANFEGANDIFSGRNFRVLRSLAKALHEWQGDNSNLNQLFAELAGRCAQFDNDSAFKTNCEEVTNPWQTQPLAEADHG